ncbi:hypothetical protein J6590_069481 [Homalodisca vitripennis]|nr:hypothetical protein J6590_069481 [Homalodisca vitripennis]
MFSTDPWRSVPVCRCAHRPVPVCRSVVRCAINSDEKEVSGIVSQYQEGGNPALVEDMESLDTLEFEVQCPLGSKMRTVALAPKINLNISVKSGLIPGGFLELDEKIAGTGIPEALDYGARLTRILRLADFPHHVGGFYFSLLSA